MESDDYFFTDSAKEIRLLDNLALSSDGTFTARIFRASVDNLPPYIATSHVWGDGKAVRPMIVTSGSVERAVPVSCNLESLLTRLLRHDKDTFPDLWHDGARLPLWIDMVCINQEDKAEKTHQIPLMREIYMRTEFVLIWLQEQDEEIDYAFAYLRKLLAVEDLWNDERLWSKFEPRGWAALIRLVACTWFQRRWTLQEAVLPRKAIFLCSSNFMAMEDLFNGLEIIEWAIFVGQEEGETAQSLARQGESAVLELLKELRELKRADHEVSLFWLLRNFHQMKTSFPSDRVFAFLALCTPEEASENIVDYDAEPSEVYKRSIATHARIHQNFDFLSLCTPDERNSPVRQAPGTPSLESRRPTWVPNWQSDRQDLGLLEPCSGVDFEFDAGLSIAVNFSVDDDRLRVRGQVLDRVESIGDNIELKRSGDMRNPFRAWVSKVFDFWNVRDVATTAYRNRDERIGIMDESVVIAVLSSQKDNLINLITNRLSQLCIEAGMEEEMRKHGIVSPENVLDGRQDESSMMDWLMLWIPFTTEKGYIGLAREGCSVGDEVWLIGGCKVPVMLSLHDSQTNERTVKGEVYLDDAMKGGLVDQSLVEDVVLV